MVSLLEIEEKEFKEFELLPKGEYILDVENLDRVFSKNNNQGFNIIFNVSHGEFLGRKVWKTFWLQGSDEPKTKTMLGIFKGFLKVCGLSKEERDSIDTEHDVLIKNFIVGKKFKARIGSKTFNEKEYNEIISYELLSAEDFPF